MQEYERYLWHAALLDLSENDGVGYRIVLSGGVTADIDVKYEEWSHDFRQLSKGYSVMVLLGYKNGDKSFICELWTGNLSTNTATPVVLNDALYPYDKSGHISPR